MRLLRLELFLGLVFVEDVLAIDLVYVTDLPVFSALAPCAQFAVSYEVQQLTREQCPAAVTALESCACTQDQNSAAISSSISSQVLYTCGNTASDDLTSASIVFSAYCNQGGPVSTQPPGPTVTQYITDLPAYSELAPCASNALSYLVMGMTRSDCNTLGPSALASCVCTKNQNSLAASESLNTQIKYSCGSTHSADITSAQAVLAGYCGLANGTSSFPTPSYLPGSVSYYITALPQYNSLASCAQEALSAPVHAQMYSDCPSNPQALVSCLCVKDSNSAMMTSQISGSASFFCGSTASANMASALSVFDFYCSVGKGLATLSEQLPAVVTTPYGSGGGGSQATATGKYSNGGASSTGSVNGNGGNGGSSTSVTNPLGSSSSGVPVAAIAGAIAGAVVFICIMLFVGWRYRRGRMHPKPPAPVMVESSGDDGRPDWSKAELPNTETTAISPKSSLLRKPVSGILSPVSPIDSPNPFSVPQRRPAEMSARPAPNRAEVPGGPNAQELQHNMRQHEVPGSNQFPVEMGASLSGPFEMDSGHHWQ
ncbi:hypothetical protein EG329_003436 [Mollisiaceae sp. DMI_Dod_QoI]|nr:hypothetical protein EG329_003436 [Helotiales sp. DMI_Dod_QoI]